MSVVTIGKVIFALFCAVIILTLVLYKVDMKKAYAQLSKYQTASVQTTLGKVTYVEKGSGIPVLLIHGICGGYDQSLESFQWLFSSQYRLIVPARFGYLGSELPAEPTPSNQADAFKQLLDKLGVEKVIVLATSAGGGSAMHFATQYPERTAGLILTSSAAPALPGMKYMSGPPDVVYTDFVMWMMTRTAKPFFLSLFGISKSNFKTAPNEERVAYNRMFNTMLPLGPRRAGVLNDKNITNPDMDHNPNNYKLEQIKTPTLILHAKDDPMAIFPPVQAMAARIPHAELIAFENGGHPIFNQSAGVKKAVAKFLAKLKLSSEYTQEPKLKTTTIS